MIDWDAIATFGAAVVIAVGAYFIGRKQTEIALQQTKIIESQNSDDRKLRQNELRLKLLDRRSDCIQEIKKASGIFSANVRLSDEEKKSLYDAIQKSELIFPPDVIEGLRDALWKTHRIPVAFKIQTNERRNGNDKKADEYLDKALALETEVFEALPKIADTMVEHARITDWD